MSATKNSIQKALFELNHITGNTEMQKEVKKLSELDLVAKVPYYIKVGIKGKMPPCLLNFQNCGEKNFSVYISLVHKLPDE